MKKFILSIGAAMFCFSQSQAQVLMGGPEVGLNLSTMSQRINGENRSTDILPGAKVGAVLDIGVSRHFSIQPGVYYSTLGYNSDYSRTVVVNNLSYTDEYSETLRLHYLDIPIHFLYKSRNNSGGTVFLGGGPYMAVAVGGVLVTERERTLQANGDAASVTETTERKIDVGTNRATDDVKPIDAGLNITGGYEFRSGLFARGLVGFGLANLTPEGNDNNYMRNINVGLSLGYMIGK